MLSSYRKVIGVLALLSLAAGIAIPFIGGFAVQWARLDAFGVVKELDLAGALDYTKIASCPGYGSEEDWWSVAKRLTRSYSRVSYVFRSVALVFGFNGLVLLLCWWKCPVLQAPPATACDGLSEKEQQAP